MTYTPHPHHRDKSYANDKSQWCITELEEINSYDCAKNNEWAYENIFWGLHLIGTPISAAILGKSRLPTNENLYIAKFVSDQDNWHGYPIAHWLSPFDKPDMSVLKKWLEAGFINRSKMSKINRGKKCTL